MTAIGNNKIGYGYKQFFIKLVRKMTTTSEKHNVIVLGIVPFFPLERQKFLKLMKTERFWSTPIKYSWLCKIAQNLVTESVFTNEMKLYKKEFQYKISSIYCNINKNKYKYENVQNNTFNQLSVHLEINL